MTEETPTGNYSVEFDGSGLSSGVYFYKMTSDGYSFTRKMMQVK
ncbi:MAG TPA: T9SS type A sorting domain-containing protein [Ignavibacteria bacterium]|nr:T9SS type A sorting domain-containing protein [Ignavibacteria bacterium]HRJ99093.1 T9SS type A sorting domain-containing protein [Ignavibacteria bacterium]